MDISSVNKHVKTKSNEQFDKAAIKYGTASAAVLWGNQQTQYYRFAEIIKFVNIDENKTTILDVGCGNGELYKYLNFVGYRGRYTGYDINKKLIQIAKGRFKDIEASVTDILSLKTKKRYDYVVTSGLFNLNVGQSMEWINKFLNKMYELSSEAIVFNMVSSHVNFKEKDIFYVDPSEVLAYCVKHLSPRVTLLHGNLPYNFTVAVFKSDKWTSV